MLFDNDERLISKALDGSEKAWVKLVKRYEKRIYNYSLRMTGATDEAMDIVQEVFLAVFRNLPNYRGDGVFPAWLFRIASNRCTDYLRRKNTNPLENKSLTDTDTLRSNKMADEDLHRSQENRELLKLLSALSTEHRQVIELKLFQNMTFDEIEGYTGLSANTAKTRFYAALQKLRNLVEVPYAV
ncbi:MAG: RNA polymerase subunit sigma-70 [Gammaproteobacteria bacterium]|nr:MAG: RNA polymerase subunit sigma-70 [Gammaproteobacteria bacterium]